MKTYTARETKHFYPLITTKERLLIWKGVKGIWKKRKPEPIQELKKIRKEWKRELPSLR